MAFHRITNLPNVYTIEGHYNTAKKLHSIAPLVGAEDTDSMRERCEDAHKEGFLASEDGREDGNGLHGELDISSTLRSGQKASMTVEVSAHMSCPDALFAMRRPSDHPPIRPRCAHVCSANTLVSGILRVFSEYSNFISYFRPRQNTRAGQGAEYRMEGTHCWTCFKLLSV